MRLSNAAAIARNISEITISADNLFELVTLKLIADSLIHRITANYGFVIAFNGTLTVSLYSMINLLD